MGWVVKATPRPLYPREIPATHCIGGWVDPRAGLDGCGKIRRHRNSIPVPPSLYPAAIPTVPSRPTGQYRQVSCLAILNHKYLMRESWAHPRYGIDVLDTQAK
jgi:hypothetical protein